MDLGSLLQNPGLTVGLALAVMLVNLVTTTAAMKITGLTTRVAVLIGFSLCQVGEFAFVLAKNGGQLGLMGEFELTLFLNMAVLTMAMTPLALALGRFLAPKLADMAKPELEGDKVEHSGHAIVVGFGVAGQGVARACRLLGRQYTVIDMNPGSVEAFRKLGEPVTYGDAVNEHVLEHVGIHHAAMLVVSIPDPLATKRIISQARLMSPGINIVARTRFLLTRDTLTKLGADTVVAEEFEAAIRVFDTVLAFYKMPAPERGVKLEAAREAGPVDFREPRTL
jgi:CPA2 family monovalent cation:H+ antiporter-2